jgi:integrase
VSQQFDRFIKEAGLRRIRFHDLRHTHASHLLAAGANPKVVSERLAHASVAFTLDVYSHVMPGQQKDAAAAVARLVGLDTDAL